MLRSVFISLACAALFISAPLVCGLANDKDVLEENGLARSGSTYVLADEADVLSGMNSLQKAKRQVDDDMRTRHSYQLQLTASKSFITQARKENDSLEERLAVVRDPAVHNRIVARMNLLVVKAKEAIENQQELTDKLGKLGSESEVKFVDDLMALSGKAEGTAKKYDDLSKNADVKAAIDKTNLTSNPHVALGPSAEFTSAAMQLKKWMSEVESEAIPTIDEHGVQLANVMLNGESHKMAIDTGSTLISLPGELAEKLKLVPGPQDPVVQIRLADGNQVEGHVMSLKSVRVGRFTVENVACVVLDKGLKDAPAILGNSFLSNFVVKLDQHANELHLLEIAPTSEKKSGNGPRAAAAEDSPAKPRASDRSDH